MLADRRTKIVATIGPAIKGKENPRKAVAAGMNVARLNFSHGSHADHLQVIRDLRELSDEMRAPITILQDLQVPKIRVGRFENGAIDLEDGEQVRITFDDVKGSPGLIPSDFKELPKSCRPGTKIMLDDGLLELRVDSVGERDVMATVPGAPAALTGTDLATKLSYFLWGSMPDDELLNVAENGGLDTADGLSKQAKRMLASPKAEAAASAFFARFFTLDALARVEKDTTRYPMWTPALQGSWQRSMELYFGEVTKPGGTLEGLLSTPALYVDSTMTMYVPNSSPTFQRITMTKAGQSGVLAQPGLMARLASPDREARTLGLALVVLEAARKSVIESNGKMDFWRVNMRPGKPLAFGEYNGIPFIGLPGNPVSAFVGFEVFVRTALGRLAGLRERNRLTVRARCEEEINSDGRESYLRASVRDENGITRRALDPASGFGQHSIVGAGGCFTNYPRGVKCVRCWSGSGSNNFVRINE